MYVADCFRNTIAAIVSFHSTGRSERKYAEKSSENFSNSPFHPYSLTPLAGGRYREVLTFCRLSVVDLTVFVPLFASNQMIFDDVSSRIFLPRSSLLFVVTLYRGTAANGIKREPNFLARLARMLPRN